MRTVAQALDHRLDQIFNDLRRELQAAMTKHRSMASAHEGHSVIREELDELWDHVKADTGTGSAARKEALQVAAMGIRYALDVCGTLTPEPADAPYDPHGRGQIAGD